MTTVGVSGLAQNIAGFLEFKRALGHPYRRGEFVLRSFQRFVLSHQEKGRFDLEQMLHGWLSRRAGRKPVTVSNDLGVLRQFCIYRRRSENVMGSLRGENRGSCCVAMDGS